MGESPNKKAARTGGIDTKAAKELDWERRASARAKAQKGVVSRG